MGGGQAETSKLTKVFSERAQRGVLANRSKSHPRVMNQFSSFLLRIVLGTVRAVPVFGSEASAGESVVPVSAPEEKSRLSDIFQPGFGAHQNVNQKLKGLFSVSSSCFCSLKV